MSPPAFVAPLALATVPLHRAITPRRGRAAAAPPQLCAKNELSDSASDDKPPKPKRSFPIDPNHHPVADIDPDSLPPAHPYGTGGVGTEVDWSDYDPVELQRQVDEARRTQAEASPAQHAGPWALLLNADIIQWKNNLFEASLADGSGFSWDLSGVRLVRISAVTAAREVVATHADLHTIECASRPIVTSVRDDCPPCLLAFAGKVEAERFADLLKADVDDRVEVLKRPTTVLGNMCEENGILIAVIPTGTLISPAMLGIKRPSAPAS